MSRLEARIAATRATIASSAASLALERGVDGTTVTDIVEAAEVGRTTFFRYFDSKELAIAEGLAGDWGDVVVEVIRRQPAELGAMDAVRAAFLELRQWFPEIEPQLRHQLRLARESRGVHAWLLAVEEMVEHAIAAAVEERFDDLAEHDPRPHLVGSVVMSASRFAMDRWLDSEEDEDLHGLMQAGLDAVTIP